MKRALAAVLVPLSGMAIGLAVLAAGLVILGYDAPTALAALWRGAFGSWYAFTAATLVRAIPLIVIGLGLAVAFRSGALNIGAEGQLTAGAIAATATGLVVGNWPAVLGVPLVLIAGAIAGAAWIAVPVVLRLRFGVLEVISTLLLNFVAEALVSFMVQGPLQEARRTYPQSDSIGLGARLPLLPGTRVHAGILLAVILAVALWWAFRRTRWGFELRAVGESPPAARVTGGIRVDRVLGGAMLVSGVFAGLAGAMEVSGVTYALYQNLSPGYGFTAIAVALIARLDPLAVLVAGLGFGALEAGAAAMQREAGVPAVAIYVVQAIVIISALIVVARTRPARAEARA